jgi:hypothetical protein
MLMPRTFKITNKIAFINSHNQSIFDKYTNYVSSIILIFQFKIFTPSLISKDRIKLKIRLCSKKQFF